jgi:diguanylate cyclase (GGDEF)-like protein
VHAGRRPGGPLRGDEFVVLLGGDAEDAVKVAERVRERVECVPRKEASSGSSLTVSVGVAEFGEETASLRLLIRAADEELYRAKAHGKTGWPLREVDEEY